MYEYPSTTFPMPTADIPTKMASQIEDMHVGDKIKAVANYEVVEKSEAGVFVEIDSIYFKTSKKRTI